MFGLFVVQGPRQGETIPLHGLKNRIGRDPEVEICLPSGMVSRVHAAIHVDGGRVFVEDLRSRNGTSLNGRKIDKREPLSTTDQLTIGEFTLRLVAPAATAREADADMPIREQVQAALSNQGLFTQNPVQKLQIVLEITQAVSTSSEVNPLLENLLGRLLQLFPRADRGLILMNENERLVVKAQQARRGGREVDFKYSRTIVTKCLKDGIAVISDDLGRDERFKGAQSIQDSKLLSLMCVPLIARDGTRLGVVQIEQMGSVFPFNVEDLRLLTTICLQVSTVIENVIAQAERIRHEVYRKELSVARDVQMGYLPTDFKPRPGYQVYAGIQPARDVSGDLYDFFPLPDGRLAFLVGDVSGKGLPAAMFMIAVRTLCRHLAPVCGDPVETLTRLNAALAADNPSMMFVTLAYGVFHPATGEVVIASGGHPAPLLIGPDGKVREVEVTPGRVLGYDLGEFKLTSTRLTMRQGETIVLYSDGISEAFAPDGEEMFGVDGLMKALSGSEWRSLEDVGAQVANAVSRFCGGDGRGEGTVQVVTTAAGIQDDQTLLLLRRL